MSTGTDVFLITGFLGSGKTTFLNRIIQAFPPGLRLMILMNEFGEIGIDGLLVKGEDLDILEISRGSIFCVCVKTDFIKGLRKIATVIQPDVLVIEATGVANPSDLKRDLNLPVFNKQFHFREQFCIIDALNFQDVYDTFTSVEKQIESSTAFIINKTDLATPLEIESVRKIVSRHHASPVFFETTFADIPLKRFLPKELKTDHGDAAAVLENAISDVEADAAIEALLKAPQDTSLPPDRLFSAVYAVHVTSSETFSDLTATLPTGLLRAKGFLHIGQGLHLFNWVMGKTELTEMPPAAVPSDRCDRIIFIASPEVMDELAAFAAKNPFLSAISQQFDPMKCLTMASDRISSDRTDK